MFLKYLIVFFVSMIPIIELRGAIPIAVGMKLPTIPSFIIAIIGNMVPVPFIFLFARRILEWGKDKKIIGGICNFFLKQGTKAGDKLEKNMGKGLFIALMLFVGIPLPGTGAWTGTLAASLLDFDFKKTTISVLAGVLLAGIIMMSLSILGINIFS